MPVSFQNRVRRECPVCGWHLAIDCSGGDLVTGPRVALFDLARMTDCPRCGGLLATVPAGRLETLNPVERARVSWHAARRAMRSRRPAGRG